MSFFKLPEINRRTQLFAVTTIFFISTILNTIINETNKMTDLFQTTMMLSIGVQGFIRLIFYLLDPHPFVEIQTLIVEFYERCEMRPDQKKNVADCLESTTKVVKFVAILYVICIFGPLVFCLANFLLTGSTVTPYPLAIPFLDRHTTAGYVANFLWQAILSFIIYIGYVQADTQMFLFAWQIMAFVDAFKCKLNDFSEELSVIMENPKPDVKEIKKQLRRAIDSYSEIRVYSDWLKRMLTRPAFAIILLSTYSVCSCGIALLIGKFYAATWFSRCACCSSSA